MGRVVARSATKRKENKHIPEVSQRHSGRERCRGTAACPPAGGAHAPAAPAAASGPAAGSRPAAFQEFPFPCLSRLLPAQANGRTLSSPFRSPLAVPSASDDGRGGAAGGRHRRPAPRRGRREGWERPGCRAGLREAGLGRGGAVGAVSRGEPSAPMTRGRFLAGAAQLLLPGGALPARPGRGGRGAGAAGRGPRAPLLPGLRRAEGR